MSSSGKISIRFFNDRKVRAVWDDATSKWWFCVVDIVDALDVSANPGNYWYVFKNRLKKAGDELLTNCKGFKLLARDGKRRTMDCIDSDGIVVRAALSAPSETHDIAQCNRAAVLMREYLEAHGLVCTTERLGEREFLCAATTPGRVHDTLWNAHLDVVPAPAALYEPRIEGDRLYARTTCCQPFSCDENAPAIKRLGDVMRRAWPDKNIRAIKMTGATDARHFVRSKAVIAVLGIDGGDCHTDAEWVGIRGIGEMADVIRDFCLG